MSAEASSCARYAGHKCVIPILVHDNADRPVYLEASAYRDCAVSPLYNRRLEGLSNNLVRRAACLYLRNGFKNGFFVFISGKETAPETAAASRSRPVAGSPRCQKACS